MSEDRSFLEREARILYRILLGAEPPSRILERYVDANRRQFGKEASGEMRKIFDRRCDVEALEFAWRLKDPRNPLTSKMHIMIYLAEAQPETFEAFFNTRSRRVLPWLILPWQFLRSVYKGFKGWILLKRWKLA